MDELTRAARGRLSSLRVGAWNARDRALAAAMESRCPVARAGGHFTIPTGGPRCADRDRGLLQPRHPDARRAARRDQSATRGAPADDQAQQAHRHRTRHRLVREGQSDGPTIASPPTRSPAATDGLPVLRCAAQGGALALPARREDILRGGEDVPDAVQKRMTDDRRPISTQRGLSSQLGCCFTTQGSQLSCKTPPRMSAGHKRSLW